MKEQNKSMRNAYITMFAIAAVVAVLGRIGMTIMGATGVFTYDYITSTAGTLLDQICTALTGPALFAFMASTGVMFATMAAGVLLYAHFAYCSEGNEANNIATAFLWGFLSVIVAVVCFVIMAGGIFTPVQMMSIENSLAIDAGTVLMVVLVVLAFVTQVAAAMLMVNACIVKGDASGHMIRWFVVTALACGTVVMLLTIPSFASVNVTHLDGVAASIWFGLDVIANVVMMAVASKLAK